MLLIVLLYLHSLNMVCFVNTLLSLYPMSVFFYLIKHLWANSPKIGYNNPKYLERSECLQYRLLSLGVYSNWSRWERPVQCAEGTTSPSYPVKVWGPNSSLWGNGPVVSASFLHKLLVHASHLKLKTKLTSYKLHFLLLFTAVYRVSITFGQIFKL